jgi:C-terminal processing protease CtpA/Prc
VDFPGQMTWWEPGRQRAARDLDIVGLTLKAESDGGFTVAGVVVRDGQPAVIGVEPGDRLLRVDGLAVTNAPMGRVIDASRGKPGDRRRLLLERAGRRRMVQAKVFRLP